MHMSITLELAKDCAAVIGAFVGLGTLIKAVIEYARQGRQKRAEQFLQMRIRLYENSKFREICGLLTEGDKKLRDVPLADRFDYLGLFEDVALMLNSNMIRPGVAHYMFGYFAILCWESEHFWHGLDRDGRYWSLFKDFAARMTEMEKKFSFDRRQLRF